MPHPEQPSYEELAARNAELTARVAELLAAEPNPNEAVIGLRNHGITVTGPSLMAILDRIEPKILGHRHRLHGEGVELARSHSDGVDVDPMAEQMLENALRYRRTYRVLSTGEQHGGGHRRMCSTQISVNSRRAVSKSIRTLPFSRSCSVREPSS